MGYSATAMANAVLVLGRHLGKGAAITLNRLENAIVAEASCTVTFSEDDALDLSLEHVHLVTLQQSDSSAESGSAIVDSIEFFQHFINVCLTVMTWSSIACRIDTRLTIQGINFQSRVITEAVIAIMFLDITGLHTGIFFDEIGSFWDILMASDVGKAQYFVTVAQHLPQLLQLVGIVGRKDNFLHFLGYKKLRITRMSQINHSEKFVEFA